jgi:hypothetical protein
MASFQYSNDFSIDFYIEGTNMANDILNTSGTTAGNQVLGRVTMKLPARTGANGTNSYDPSGTISYHTGVLVSEITGEYEVRFDDPTYYGG